MLQEPVHDRRRPHCQRGFSLPEMLATVAVVAITTSLGAPALGSFVSGNRASSQVNTLIGALTLARSEAVAGARRVSLCPIADSGSGTPEERYGCAVTTDWAQGWIVYRDAIDDAGLPTGEIEIVRVYDALIGGDALTGSVSALSYLPTGFLDTAAAAPTFSLVPTHCSASQRRTVTISLQGQSHVATANC